MALKKFIEASSVDHNYSSIAGLVFKAGLTEEEINQLLKITGYKGGNLAIDSRPSAPKIKVFYSYDEFEKYTLKMKA